MLCWVYVEIRCVSAQRQSPCSICLGDSDIKVHTRIGAASVSERSLSTGPQETPMDDKAFRKHLAALVHGHHHPEEHDWAGEGRAKTGGTAKPAKKASRNANG